MCGAVGKGGAAVVAGPDEIEAGDARESVRRGQRGFNVSKGRFVGGIWYPYERLARDSKAAGGWRVKPPTASGATMTTAAPDVAVDVGTKVDAPDVGNTAGGGKPDGAKGRSPVDKNKGRSPVTGSKSGD